MQGCVKISVQNCQNMSLSQFVYGFIPHKLEHKIINKSLKQKKRKRREKINMHGMLLLIVQRKIRKKEKKQKERKEG